MSTALTQPMERAKLAWRRSPLPRFLRWWAGELIALLPTRLRDWVQRGPDVLWLIATPEAVTLRRARDSQTVARISAALPSEAQRAEFAQACAGIDVEDRRLLLVVPAAQILERRLVLPVAAAGEPRRVAGYEIDRQTPFKPDQVYFDARVSTQPVPAGQVALDLFVVPRAAVDPMLERCAALGAYPDALDVQNGGGELAGVDLLPAGRRPRRVDRRRRANWMLAAACVLLAVLVLSQWLGNRRAALATMQQQVDAMRAHAKRSEQLRAQLTGAIAASKILVKRKTQDPSTLALLDDLTTRLPSTAWLDALTLDQSGNLDIRGEAVKAAALVDRIGQSPLLDEPKLQGVIQPDPATGKERFELTARLHRGAAADAH